MSYKFCVGLCPYCEGNGLLLFVRDKETKKLHMVCDECYQSFLSYDDVKMKDSDLSPNLFCKSVELDEAIAYGWKDYIYVLENNKYLKYTDKTRELYQDNGFI